MSLAASGLRLLRQEKIVLVVDLVESVTLMQAHELDIIERWQAFLVQVKQVILPTTKGRLVKSLGDGLMVEFDLPRSAVEAAFAMHAWFEEPSSESGQAPMCLRVGLHGTHVYEGEHDIYGAGVNLAARVAALAQPGHTVATAAARDGLVEGLDCLIDDLGDWYLKHVDGAVRIFDIRTRSQSPAVSIPQRPPPTPRPVIAVLPFETRAGGPEFNSLGNLIAEGVIGQLSRTQEIKVLSHLSTSALRGRADALDDARSFLGAAFVVSGSFAAMGARLLVLAEFTDVERNEVVWSERLSADIADLMQPQSEVCTSIANGCHKALLDSEAREALGQPLPSLQSYSLLLGGIGLMHRSAPDEFLKTREVLDVLIERHNRCASPRVWLAKWYVLSSTRGLADDPQAQARLALQETRRALDAEPGNALAWAMQGFVYCHLIKDVDRALKSCAQAIEWNPNESLAWLFKGIVHAFEGDGAQALPAGMKALELSPLDPLRYYYHSLMASIAISAERYDLAIDFARRSLRGNASHLSSYRALMLAQALSGDAQAARLTCAQLLQRDPSFTVARFATAYPSRERVPDYLERLKAALRVAGVDEA